jgi:GTPase SAR1 family protein
MIPQRESHRGVRRALVRNLKAVMVGESTVGKTSILTVANVGEFDREATPTVGACFVSNNYTFQDRSVRLNLWDTAGRDRQAVLVRPRSP